MGNVIHNMTSIRIGSLFSVCLCIRNHWHPAVINDHSLTNIWNQDWLARICHCFRGGLRRHIATERLDLQPTTFGLHEQIHYHYITAHFQHCIQDINGGPWDRLQLESTTREVNLVLTWHSTWQQCRDLIWYILEHIHCIHSIKSWNVALNWQHLQLKASTCSDMEHRNFFSDKIYKTFQKHLKSNTMYSVAILVCTVDFSG